MKNDITRRELYRKFLSLSNYNIRLPKSFGGIHQSLIKILLIIKMFLEKIYKLTYFTGKTLRKMPAIRMESELWIKTG